MYNLLPLISLSALTGAAILPQQPLFQDHSEARLIKSPEELVSSASLEAHITKDALLKRAKHLSKIADEGIPEYNHPTRVIGSQGHLSTIDYIYSALADLGDYYEISNQTFDAVVGNVFESRLVLGDTEPESVLPFALTPPTPSKKAVFGPLVLVANDGCDASDFPADTKGAIAFIKRGVCPFGQKSEGAGRAGAVAAVIYNHEKGSMSGTLGEPSPDHVATFGISDSDAKPYIKKLKQGKVIPSSAYIDSVVSNAPTTNIVAQTKGGDQENCVMLGGHSDSVAEGPGINDDGSGSLTLLEIATHLVNYKVNNCVRFAWWAGEEEGLLGSTYYVSQLSKDENLKIRLFMDYDMLASSNYAFQVYDATDAANPVGSEGLRDLYIDYYVSHGKNYTFIPFDGRSDYQAFIENGIPGGGIATGAEGIKTDEEAAMFGGTAGDWYDPCYHQLCDIVENLALEAWEFNSKLVAHSVATFALSFDGFPQREEIQAAAKSQLPLYRGNRLVM